MRSHRGSLESIDPPKTKEAVSASTGTRTDRDPRFPFGFEAERRLSRGGEENGQEREGERERELGSG